jgi:hypothetical protein
MLEEKQLNTHFKKHAKEREKKKKNKHDECLNDGWKKDE